MPYKDPVIAKQKAHERYERNKHLWKNPDGTWKQRSYSEKRDYRIAYYHANKEKIRSYYRERRKRLQRLGSCAICSRGPVKLVYDHDHETGLFRDWLCLQCNVMLGMAQDKLEVLNGAARYVEKHRRDQAG